MPLLALLLLLAADAPEPVRGRLCIGESRTPLAQCSDVTGTAFAIEPQDRERLFVWTSAGGATAQIGRIVPKAETIELEAGKRTTLDLSIAGEPSRGWPADVDASIAQQDRVWQWTLTGSEAARLRKLIVPRGRTILTLRAKHHRALTRSIEADILLIALRELKLMPIPHARGTVVDVEGKPIAGALVTRMDATQCGVTDDRGSFACEVEQTRAQDGLTISSGGYASHDLVLPGDIRTDVDFGRITLTKGHTLTVRIIRPDAGPATVTLFRDVDDRYEHARLATRDIRESREEVRFDAGDGSYFVLVSGAGEGERLEVPLTVNDADASERITVDPYRVIGTARLGDDAIADGRLILRSPQHTWRVDVPVKDGSFATTLWQHSRLFTFLQAPELGRTLKPVEMPETAGTDPTRWDIRLEKRMIAGRVFNAETKEPVPGAQIEIVTETENGRSQATVTTDDDGAYRILAMYPGTYSLFLDLPDYAPATIHVPVASEDKIKMVDVALERGASQLIQIALASGAPAGGAWMIEGLVPDRVNPQYVSTMAPTGEYVVRGKPGETRVIFIVPREGSFMPLRFVMPRGPGARPLSVVVPGASATLRVRATRDGKPAAARVLVRYNGEFVPRAVLGFLAQDFTGTKTEGEVVIPRLPAGMYEVWALADPGEEQRLIASGGALRAPARVGLSGGESVLDVVVPR